MEKSRLSSIHEIIYDYSKAYVIKDGKKIIYSDDPELFWKEAYTETGAFKKVVHDIKEIVINEKVITTIHIGA